MWPKSIVSILVLSVLALMCLSISALADKRVALILGNSAYMHIIKLGNPENDARDLAETLRKLNFEVIIKTNIDHAGLDNALEEFERKALGADTAFFYFAGHGLQFNGRNFLLPIDAQIEDEVSLRYNTLSIDKVRQALDAATGVKIMVLDACRNNPLAERLLSRSAGISRNAETTRGLARLDRAEGMVVAYATQADQVAQDGAGRNSPFSSALIRRLQEPNLEIATMFRRVAQDVFEQTAGRQRPEMSISLLQDFFLNPQDDGARLWMRIGASGTEDEIKQFIAKYPNSPYARDAQSRLYVLGTIRQVFQRQENLLRETESKEACAREAGQIDRMIQEGQRDGLVRLKPILTCASLAVSVDKALETLADRERSCRDESRALRQIHDGDIEAFEKFIAGATCPSIQKNAGEVIATLKTQSAKQQAVCLAEAERLGGIRSKQLNGQQLLSELMKFQASLTCISLRPEVAEAIKSIDEEQQKVEKVRARLAALEAARHQAETDAAKRKNLCQAEAERIDVIKSRQTATPAIRLELMQLKDHLACKELQSVVADAITSIDDEEQKRVEKVRARLAALETDAEAANRRASCRSETERLRAIKSETAGRAAWRSELTQLQDNMACAELRPEVAAAIKAIDTEEQLVMDKVRSRLTALDAWNGKIETQNAERDANCYAEGERLATIRSKQQGKSQLLSELKAFLLQSKCENQRLQAAKTLTSLEPANTNSSN